MKQVYQKIGYWSGVVAVSAVLAMTLHYVGAWVEPSTTPPSSNVGAPINTGSSGQYKAGALGVGGVLKAYGNVVIGSALSPNNAKGAEGYLTVKDVYINDSGKWASEIDKGDIVWMGKGGVYLKEGAAAKTKCWMECHESSECKVEAESKYEGGFVFTKVSYSDSYNNEGCSSGWVKGVNASCKDNNNYPFVTATAYSAVAGVYTETSMGHRCDGYWF